MDILNLGSCVLFFMLYGSLNTALYVAREKQDIIRNISISSCNEFLGIYNSKTKECMCPPASSTFTRGPGNVFSCRKVSIASCHFSYQEDVKMMKQLFRIDIQLQQTLTCPKPSFSTLDGGHNIGGMIVPGSFHDMNALKTNSTLFYGRVMKVEYGCIKKCVIVKQKGQNEYNTSMVKTTLATTDVPIVTHGTIQYTVSIKLGVIGAVLSIMMALCGFIVLVVHYRPLAS